MRLPRRFVGEVIAHAIEDDPNECCGIIAGVDGRATKLYRARNAAASPYRYEVHSKDLLHIMREIDDRDWDVFAIYHSHVATQAYPSKTDVGLAVYPEAYYILVSLEHMDAPVAKSYRIVDGEIAEEQLEVVPDDEGIEIQRLG